MGEEILVGLSNRGVRQGGVPGVGARRVTSDSNGDGDVWSFLECWESCGQGEGLADAAS